MSKTYYEVLGVPSNAGDQEIKIAYHRLARKYHPDKAAETGNLVAMEAEFSMISTAYNVLKDKEKRSAYDRTLDVKRQQGMGKSGATSAMPSSSDASGVARGPSMGGSTVGAAAATADKNRAAVARRAFLKGLQLMTVGDYHKAAEFFEVALKNYDLDPNYHAKLAQSLLRGHRSFSRATEAAQKAITLDPFNSDYRFILAELYESAGSTTLAIKCYEEILKWDQSNERAMQALDSLNPRGKSLISRLFGKRKFNG